MKHRTIALALIVSLLSITAVGFPGCGQGNTLVAISVTPAERFIAKGTVLFLPVRADFSDGKFLLAWTQVTWQSSAPDIATVSSTGLVTAVSDSTSAAVITATDKAHPSITCDVTVHVMSTPLVSIDVQPPNSIVSLGTTTQFTTKWTLADGTELLTPGSAVNWSSSNPGVATISNRAGSEGLAEAVGEGTTLIVATDPVTNISGLTTLTVTAPTVTL